ncbi:hypothetical protein [Numidum massiliense]|uniref:hypothetical protein n=1 Tax=Numidum massiliense TaxID=1522315 RepID=UPI0006D56E43|nr:hypothetical protein [Numidum massiliense]
MIFEKTDINESEKLKDVKVTLEGVQYTEITPTDSYKKSFKNFGNDGIVAITVKFSLDNQSKQTIGTTTSSKISVDGNRGTVLSAGLDPNARDLKLGAKSEKLEVFLLRKDEFELFKTFVIAFGPLYDENAKEISKGQTVKFKLPNK